MSCAKLPTCSHTYVGVIYTIFIDLLIYILKSEEAMSDNWLKACLLQNNISVYEIIPNATTFIELV